MSLNWCIPSSRTPTWVTLTSLGCSMTFFLPHFHQHHLFNAKHICVCGRTQTHTRACTCMDTHKHTHFFTLFLILSRFLSQCFLCTLTGVLLFLSPLTHWLRKAWACKLLSCTALPATSLHLSMALILGSACIHLIKPIFWEAFVVVLDGLDFDGQAPVSRLPLIYQA